MKVLVQLRSSAPTHDAAMVGAPLPSLPFHIEAAAGLSLDSTYPPVQVPGVKTASGGGMVSLGQPLEFSLEPSDSTYLVRGQIPDGAAQAAALTQALKSPDVIAIYSDPLIETTLICPGSHPLGTYKDVAKNLSVTRLAAKKMTGQKVFLAIVDTGINIAHLKSMGQNPKLDAGRSWVPPGVSTLPGNHAVGHGTMCAFDAGIAAPNARLLDYAVLLSTTPGGSAMAGLLSDAVLAYSKLRTILLGTPASNRAMVISNSWGMFSPTWDFPIGHPSNYSDNPNHPFNIIVANLESLGADILFAAGNCGRDCPDGRCNFGTTPPICGANSHPAVLSVAGVDVKKNRVGYSSQGPGRLTKRKPDIAAYTHFKGSQVYPADGGTSAACPVAAGVIAAVRSRYPASALTPLQMRTLVCKTALDRGKTGYDFDYGFGIIDPAKLISAL